MSANFLSIFGAFDTYLIEPPKPKKMNYFGFSGFIILIYIPFSVFGIYYGLNLIASQEIISLLVSLLFTFININMMRFIISSAIWNMSNNGKLNPPSIGYSVLKLLAISLLVLITTLCFETYFFEYQIFKIIYLHSNEIYVKSSLFFRLSMLKKHLPITWLFSIFITLFFMIPMIWRLFLRSGGNEAYQKALNNLHKTIVLDEYANFKEFYTQITESKFGHTTNFYEAYSDAPFNRVPKTNKYQLAGVNLLYDMLDQATVEPEQFDDNSAARLNNQLPPPHGVG
ncbi:MAG: hypothetical protein SGJ00_07585 [bacterium]|nr:hypothetical protein [bacterium]